MSEYALRDFVKRLIERAIFSSTKGKPGDLIKRLSKEDRELVKELKAEHFNHRV